MIKALLFVLVCIALVLVGVSDAETLYQSGNAFARQCGVIDKDEGELTPLDLTYVMACYAYVVGIVNGVEAEQHYATAALQADVGTPYCLPVDQIESAQAVRITLKYIRDNPSQAHRPAGALVIKAIHDVFPCSASAK
jgi:cytochrome b